MNVIDNAFVFTSVQMDNIKYNALSSIKHNKTRLKNIFHSQSWRNS